MPNSNTKVLILDDEVNIAEIINRELKTRGYDTVVLVTDHHSIRSDIEKIIKKEKPKYVIIDDLREEYLILAKISRQLNAVPIIFTGKAEFVKSARDKGYTAFKKPYTNALIDFLDSKNKCKKITKSASLKFC